MLCRQKQLLTYMNLNLTHWVDLLKRNFNPRRPPLLPRLSRKTDPPISKFLRLCDTPKRPPLLPRLSPKKDPPNSKFLRLCNTPRLPPLCPFEVLNPDPSNFQLPRLWLIPKSARVPLPLSFVMSPVTVVFFCAAALFVIMTTIAQKRKSLTS